MNRLIKFYDIDLEENEMAKTQIKIRIDNCLYEVTFHIVPNSYISCDALIASDFLDNVAKMEKGVITIISVPEQNSDWSQVNRIHTIEEADKIDLT